MLFLFNYLLIKLHLALFEFPSTGAARSAFLIETFSVEIIEIRFSDFADSERGWCSDCCGALITGFHVAMWQVQWAMLIGDRHHSMMIILPSGKFEISFLK